MASKSCIQSTSVVYFAITILMLTCTKSTTEWSQSAWAISCYNESIASWHRWSSFLKKLQGTKCNIQCSANCTCSLDDFNSAVIHCENTNSTVGPVPYPTKVSFLSWAGSRLHSFTEDSFTGFPTNPNFLDLGNNSFRYLQPRIFTQLPNLRHLILRHNQLNIIDNNTFNGLHSLNKLDLSDNHIHSITTGGFYGLNQLVTLDLSGNELEYINSDILCQLPSLDWLDLNYNKLRQIDFQTYDGKSDLRYLLLKDNQISILMPYTFRNFVNLIELDLSNNALTYIYPETFQNLIHLKTLELYNNQLNHLAKGTLDNLHKLRYLDMSGNRINRLDFGLFQGCWLLKTLEITQNPLKWINHDSFEGLNDTVQIIVENAATCCFVDQAWCNSTSAKSPFLTCGRLLPFHVLRVGIWIISVLALFNNVLGIIVRSRRKTKPRNKVQLLLITNLSISDFLMGVYLIILLVVDLYYQDYFPSHSEFWRNSLVCNISGAISILSSETSVFFITLISIDRYLRVKYPLGTHLLTIKSLYIFIPALWLVAGCISSLSFIFSFLDYNIYNVSETCVGLPISRQPLYIIEETTIPISTGRPKENFEGVLIQQLVHTGSKPAIQFSFVIFVILNLLCFSVVGFCYVSIFISVRKSAKRSGLAISKKEIHMAKKLSLLVLTDFCCWVPIGVLSVLIQAGVVEVNPTAHAWIATFILPINSSINPFLYTLGDVIADKVTCSCKKCKSHLNGASSGISGTLHMDILKSTYLQ